MASQVGEAEAKERPEGTDARASHSETQASKCKQHWRRDKAGSKSSCEHTKATTPRIRKASQVGQCHNFKKQQLVPVNVIPTHENHDVISNIASIFDCIIVSCHMTYVSGVSNIIVRRTYNTIIHLLFCNVKHNTYIYISLIYIYISTCVLHIYTIM